MTILSRRPAAFTRADRNGLPDDGRRHELVDGTLIASPAPRADHWLVLGFLVRADRLRQQTDAGHPESGSTSGLVAYLAREPVGWRAVEPRTGYAGLSRRPSEPGSAGCVTTVSSSTPRG